MSFANQLKQERQRLSLTQAEAAAILEVSKSALEKWEAGQKTPKALMREGALARLARLQPAAERQNTEL
jgi:DNA-binding transcriptional regulator YiaG